MRNGEMMKRWRGVCVLLFVWLWSSILHEIPYPPTIIIFCCTLITFSTIQILLKDPPSTLKDQKKKKIGEKGVSSLPIKTLFCVFYKASHLIVYSHDRTEKPYNTQEQRRNRISLAPSFIQEAFKNLMEYFCFSEQFALFLRFIEILEAMKEIDTGRMWFIQIHTNLDLS